MNKKKEKKKPVITEVTKRFNEAVETVIGKGLASNYKGVADAIKWSESGMSTARKQEINVPSKYIKSFEEVFNVRIISGVQDEIVAALMRRVSKLEAQGEIYEDILGDLLKSVNGKSANTNVSEIRQEVLERLRSNLSEAKV